MNARKREPAVIATWKLGKAAAEAAGEVLRAGGRALDAVEAGINVVELDPKVTSVGYGGRPNAEGIVELDAAIMDGPSHNAGAVAALRNIRRPISVARKVMEQTPHVMLADDGALAAGCSTSGLAYKLPGRVGDSPIIGSGLYVDNDVGGAAATGVGEEIMKFCAGFLVVEFMRSGCAPDEACRRTIARILAKTPANKDVTIALIALSRDGQFGAASTRPEFPHAVWTPAGVQMRGS
ncbi:MAG: isoaspartyl peptidase/L-asparaginase, partial [Candidatus Brocadiae bacterium]|nr:isoaspartyl peptidase/L-asparaginase [Candidatus Brocadiia bacterium]